MRLVIKVWLEAEGGKAFGDGILDLLERVRNLGSLRKAAAEIGMSYSQAWRLVRDLGARLGCDLLAAEAGGEGGGRSVLTPEGLRWVEAYGAFRRECQVLVVEAFERHCGHLVGGGYDVAEPGRRRRS